MSETQIKGGFVRGEEVALRHLSLNGRLVVGG